MIDLIKRLQDDYEIIGDDDWTPLLKVVRNYKRGQEITVDEVLEEVNKIDTEEWTRIQVVGCLKNFDTDFGFGKFTKGAQKYPSRLKWVIEPRIVADAILEGETSALSEALADLTRQKAARVSTVYAGKQNWGLEEIKSLLAAQSGLSVDDLEITMTMPEARTILANSQGIPLNDVSIKLG